MVEWHNFVKTSQDSLRVLADLTGGIAVINQNDFSRALQRIDNETSDYYVLGYISSNPDPLQKRRRIEVKVNRPGVHLMHRTEYTLRRPPARRPLAAVFLRPFSHFCYNPDRRGAPNRGAAASRKTLSHTFNEVAVSHAAMQTAPTLYERGRTPVRSSV
jgi:hypothetical protein